MRTIPNISAIDIPVNTSTTAQIAKDNKQYGDTFPPGSFGITKIPIRNRRGRITGYRTE
jgi:hypothetical protein